MRWLPYVLGMLSFALPRPARADSTAFFYGARVPEELLTAYEQVVVEPSHFAGAADFAGAHAVPVAYLSVGEVSSHSEHARHLAPDAVLLRNQAWQSLVLDLTRDAVRKHLLEERFETLWSAGYRRFFLDTLDSYQLAAEPARPAQRAALVALIEEMARRHPDAKLLLNRGFELLPELSKVVHGIVAESLFDGWNQARNSYEPVAPSAREWLLAQLKRAHDEFGLEVTVIDYRPPSQRAEARLTAQRIRALGFTPWVADGALHAIGVGDLEIIPRRVLIVGSSASEADGLPEALRLLGPVLEHMGCIPEYRALSELEKAPALGSLRGIILWQPASLSAELEALLAEQVSGGVRLVVFGEPGLPRTGKLASLLKLSWIEPTALKTRGALSISERDAVARYEAEPTPVRMDVSGWRPEGARVAIHLGLADARGRRYPAVFSDTWGGMALGQYLAERGLHGERAWVIDPHRFLELSLGSTALPAPDLTTEHGQRLAMFVLRPHGLAGESRLRGRPKNAAVLARLVKESGFPHAVDLTAEDGAAARKDSLAARSLARSLGLSGQTLSRSDSSFGASEPSVTGLRPQTAAAGASVRLPMADDRAFIPEGVDESYPYARWLDAALASEQPRRLTALSVDYHAESAASPGGHAALTALYARLRELPLFPLLPAAYADKVSAFRRQVLVRHLDGSYGTRGGDELLTLRLPSAAMQPDTAASVGLASAHTAAHGQGSYVTFLPKGERRLHLSADPVSTPRLSRTNARVESLSLRRSGAALQLTLDVTGHGDLALTFAGLPASVQCSLRTSRGTQQAASDHRGELSARVAGFRRGRVVLACPPERRND